MINLSSQVLILFSIYFFGSLLLSTLILRAINNSSKTYLSLLHVKADKSPTNASLLGGLGLSAVSFIAILACLIYSDFFSSGEIQLLKYSLLPIIIVTVYGFLDDKYEIRARHKLSLQFLAITSFALPVSAMYDSNNYSVLFSLVVFGLAYINGCNLIDGLDTIFVKLGTAIALVFLFISVQLISIPSIILSFVTIAALISFYFYNREPAKIYAGEIGGSVLGVIFFIQGNLLLEKAANFHTNISLTGTMAKVLIASIYPLGELTISFTRRVLSMQSPFRGDQLHLHHVIKSKYQLTAAQTATIICCIFVMTAIMGFVVFNPDYPLLSLSLAIISFTSFYVMICQGHWRKSYSKQTTKDLFVKLNNNQIYVIDGKSIDMFYYNYQKSLEKKSENRNQPTL